MDQHLSEAKRFAANAAVKTPQKSGEIWEFFVICC
jgi:hypothetical protein